MHSLHGNAGRLGDSMVHLRVCNVAGLQKTGRSEFLAESTANFLAITERHANAYTQRSFARELKEYSVLFGVPVGDRGFAGVGFTYKKSSAWAVKEVTFFLVNVDNSMMMLVSYAFRLSGVQQRDLSSFTFCTLNLAQDGNLQKRSTTNSRCVLYMKIPYCVVDVATVFCGDANLTVEDAPDVFDSFRKSRWVDSAWYGIGGFDDRPTSLQGNGARIDLAFVNHTASSPVFHYQLVEGVNKDDRRMLDTSLRVPLACQYWYMSKRIGARDDHVNPPHDYVPPHIATDERIRRCLLEKKIDEAYKRWVKNAEGWFNKIPLVKGRLRFWCRKNIP